MLAIGETPHLPQPLTGWEEGRVPLVHVQLGLRPVQLPVVGGRPELLMATPRHMGDKEGQRVHCGSRDQVGTGGSERTGTLYRQVIRAQV